MGDRALEIEHVGSTSVKGLWAKPQIDILVIVESLESVDDVMEEMKRAGYTYQRYAEGFNEKYFTRDAPTGERLVSVHVRSSDNKESVSALQFRDYLRTHPKDRERYSNVKRAAYEQGVDRVRYAEEKQEVIRDIIEKVQAWTKDKNSDSA